MHQPRQNNPLDDIRRLACSRLTGIQALYLFGSWGSEHQTTSSDIDIALLLTPQESKRFTANINMQLSIEIAEIAAVERADVIDLRTADCILQTQVISYGQRFFTSDENAALNFEGLALSSYQKLQQERADIIKDGLASGRFLNG